MTTEMYWRAQQGTPAWTTTHLVKVGEIDRFEVMPGDVILTTRTGAVPALLRAAAGVPVSHAAIMVTADYAIEARDDAWDLSDSGGQVYVRSLDEVLDHPEIELVVFDGPRRSMRSHSPLGQFTHFGAKSRSLQLGSQWPVC